MALSPRVSNRTPLAVMSSLLRGLARALFGLVWVIAMLLYPILIYVTHGVSLVFLIGAIAYGALQGWTSAPCLVLGGVALGVFLLGYFIESALDRDF